MKQIFKNLTARANVLLVLLGCLALLLYFVSLRARAGDHIEWFIKLALVQSVVYLAAVAVILKLHTSRRTLHVVLIFAALFRLSILFAPPYLSDDIYRYVWDGRVQAAGINPYRYVPNNENLRPLRDDSIYPRINRRDYAHTIYPPGAQLIYFLATRVSERVTWMKLVMVVFEAVAIWALIQLLISFNLPAQRILLFAWHPLLVWEIAGSGHVDAVSIAFISLALLARRRNRDAIAGASLAAATLIKLIPIILLPALYRRWSWKLPVVFLSVVALAYLPYLSVGRGVLGFLPGYVQEEGLQSGSQFFLLNVARIVTGEANLPAAFYLGFAALVLVALAGWSIRKSGELEWLRCAAVLATTFIVLLSPRYAWYFAWLVPFTCFLPSLALFYLTTACLVLYQLWHPTGPTQLLYLNTFIYVPFALLSLGAWFRRRLQLTSSSREHVLSPGGISDGTS